MKYALNLSKNKKSLKSKAKKPAKKAATKKPKKAEVTFSVRQLPQNFTTFGSRHVVRLVEDCEAKLLSFDSVDALNAWLFEFDFNNHGKNPMDSGTWVDQIFMDVRGKVFDSEELESNENMICDINILNY